MVRIFTMSVGNVQEWSVKVLNHLNNYLRSYDNLKSTKGLPIIIMYAHSIVIVLTENRMVRNSTRLNRT